MTKELKPGRELDALIAEKVMPDRNTFQVIHIDFAGGVGGNGEKTSKYGHEQTPPYSTSIAAAWEVVESLSKRHMPYQVNHDDHGHTASFDRKYAFGSSAPHAICLAALKAVGYES